MWAAASGERRAAAAAAGAGASRAAPAVPPRALLGKLTMSRSSILGMSVAAQQVVAAAVCSQAAGWPRNRSSDSLRRDGGLHDGDLPRPLIFCRRRRRPGTAACGTPLPASASLSSQGYTSSGLISRVDDGYRGYCGDREPRSLAAAQRLVTADQPVCRLAALPPRLPCRDDGGLPRRGRKRRRGSGRLIVRRKATTRATSPLAQLAAPRALPRAQPPICPSQLQAADHRHV